MKQPNRSFRVPSRWSSWLFRWCFRLRRGRYGQRDGGRQSRSHPGQPVARILPTLGLIILVLSGVCLGRWLLAERTVHVWASPETARPVAIAPLHQPAPLVMQVDQSPPDPLVDQLYQIAQAITVQVKTREAGGSGVLIRQRGQLYTVLTNHHVLTAQGPYWIETDDGQTHYATRTSDEPFPGQDLALLTFISRSTHRVARVAGRTSQPKIPTLDLGHPLVEADEEVFAAGFPYEVDPGQSRLFQFTRGRVALTLDQALEGGYRLGYTNAIEKGMSGGPILNRAGQLVGVNGRHSHPLWGDPYVYADGSTPPQALRLQMAELSWGIPISEISNLIVSLP